MISLFHFIYKSFLRKLRLILKNIISFASEYADDGFNGGAIDEILKLFQEGFRLIEEYDLNNYILYLLDANSFYRDINILQALGYRIDVACNIQILKAPIWADPRNI